MLVACQSLVLSLCSFDLFVHDEGQHRFPFENLAQFFLFPFRQVDLVVRLDDVELSLRFILLKSQVLLPAHNVIIKVLGRL